MADKSRLIGWVVFLALLGFVVLPIAYNLVIGKGILEAETPVLELPKDQKQCIESAEWMRENHMQLLDIWRDNVARDGQRIYTSSSGKKHNMSLQNECLGCHTSKERFCDRCHEYVSVKPKCWACHITPEFLEDNKEKIAKGE